MRSLTNSGNGPAVPDDIRAEAGLHASAHRCYMVCCICFGSLQQYRGMLTFTGRLWDASELPDRLRNTLDPGEAIWAVPERNGNEGSVLLALRDCAAERVRPILDRLTPWGKETFSPFTLCAGEPFRCIGELSESYARTYQALTQKLVFGRSSCVRASDTSYSPVPLSRGTDAAFFTAASGGGTGLLLGELQTLLRKAEAHAWTQLQLDFAVKQTLYAGLQACGHSAVDVETAVHEAIGSRTDYDGLQRALNDFVVSLLGPEAGDERTDLRLTDLHRYVQEHYAEPLSLGELADRLQLSRSSLTRLYKKKFGAAPMEHIIQLRMEKAREMMIERPHMPIRAISQIVGYEDPYYFSRMFKLYTGMNPSAYRGTGGKNEKISIHLKADSPL